MQAVIWNHSLNCDETAKIHLTAEIVHGNSMLDLAKAGADN